MAIDYKTTSTLIDELVTTKLKGILGGQDVKIRLEELSNSIIKRTGYPSIGTIVELAIFNTLCWMAQEDILNKKLPKQKRFDAAIQAQTFNAARSKAMRNLDLVENQTDIGVLGKTYD